MKKFIATLLLLSNFAQIAFAGFPAALNDTVNRQNAVPTDMRAKQTPQPDLQDFTLNTEQLGIAGPFTGSANYSSLTGAFISGQFLKKINEFMGFNILGEYGDNQFRINGTFGFYLAPQTLFKVSAEQLGQRLPFAFDSGNIKKTVKQQALGARLQQFVNFAFIDNFSLGTYTAYAPNVRLDPVLFTSNGLNCSGFESGFTCLNERNIAGARAAGGDLGLGFYATPSTYLEAKGFYDSLRYHTIFTPTSPFDNHGFGGGVYAQQLLNAHLKITASAEMRKIYDDYNFALSWMPNHPFARGTELSLKAQHVESHNDQIPNNNIVGLQLNLFADRTSYQALHYRLNGAPSINDIAQWLQNPAVKMSQVLAMAEQYTHLASAHITSINPSSGPLDGGNPISISGYNFLSGTTVEIGGKIAQLVSLNNNLIIVTAPPGSSPGFVDVVLTIPGSLPVIKKGGYAYNNGIAPIISSVSPSTVNTGGGTTIMIQGSGLSGVNAVTIGGTPALSFTIISDNLISAVTPPHTAGPVPLTVTTSGGTSDPQILTYVTSPATIGVINPNSGPTAGGTNVVINGSGFLGTTSVNFGGSPATNLVVVNDTMVTVTTGPHAAGLVNVVVSNGSTNTTRISGYTYTAALPLINQVNPSSGSTSGGTAVTLSGSGFTGASNVNFGGIAATSFTVDSDTQISAVSPAHGAGTVNVTVTTAGGTSAPQPFTYQAPLPVLNSLNPTSGTANGGTTVTLSGTGFLGATAVSIDGSPIVGFNVINDTQISFITPSHSTGTVSITVTTPGGTSGGQAFQYVTPSGATISSTTPSSGSTAGGDTLTINGSGLTGTTGVSLGGVAATNVTVVNDSQVTAVTPSHIAGIVDVVVFDGSSNITAPGAFTYVAPVPAINPGGISPSSGPTAGGTAITISGSGFIGATNVDVGGTPASSFTVVSDTQITALTPAHAAGVANIRVTTAGGTSAPQAFTYVAPTPVINVNGITPNSGTSLGGTTILIQGSGFTGASAVQMSGTPVSSFNVLSDTQISAVTQAHAPGVVNTVVITAGGTSAPQPYTFIAPPIIISDLNPSSGSTAGGDTITINGLGLTGTTSISFGGVAATSVTVVNDGQVTAVTPSHIAGAVDVVISNGTTNTTAPGAFTYVAPVPSINPGGISPSSGPTGGGTAITISGSGFTGATNVDIGGTPASSFTVVSDTQITALTPAHAAGVANVRVTTAGGTSTGQPFTYVAPIPVLNTVNPGTGSSAGGTTVVLSGTGFTGTTAVNLDGSPVPGFTVVDDTQILFVTPPHAAGTINITVTTPGGTSSNQPFQYTGVAGAVIGNVTPTSGSTAGGEAVTINGSGLTGTTVVTLGGTPATNVTVVNDTQVTAITPSHVAGIFDVVVSNGSTNTTAQNAYTYVAPLPVINVGGVSPSSGPTAGGTAITLSGSGFIGATSVIIGGIPVTSYTVDSDTQISAVTPAHIAGTANITVTTAGGTSAPVPFNYVAPLPVINLNGISPTSGTTLGGTTITITGSGFTNATAVSFGGSAAASFTVFSDTQMTAITPAHAAGAVDVTVTTSGGTSAPQPFTYVAPPIVVSNLTPTSGTTAGGDLVTITGSGLTGTTTVSFGGTPATNVTVINDTQVTAVTAAHGAGVVDVVVSNGDTNATSPVPFTYTAALPAINVGGISPNSGPTAGGTAVTISGSGFTAATQVTIGGVPALSYTVNSDTQISALTPAHVAGSVNVTVTTAGGTSAPQPFTYIAPVPVINLNGITPSSGTTLGGTTITITGSGFIGATAVTLDGSAATNFTVQSDTQITAITPAHTQGTVDVVVTSAGGSSAPQPYIYVAPPTVISNITPNSGPTAGGNTVTINGSGLTGTTSVRFDGTAATNVTVVNDTQVTATAPSHAAATVDIVVSNGSTNTTAPLAYTYVAPVPTINSGGISPNSGPTSGGTAITITGTGFIAATSVTIGGTPVISYTVNSDTQISAVTAAHAAGTFNTTVTTAGGTSAPESFTYVAPTPVINANGIVPSSGTTLGGTTITISGSGFTNATAVTLDGNAATSFTVLSDTQISAVTPAHTAGAVNVTVTTAGGTSAPQIFTYIVPPPSIVNISPTSGSTAGGNTVTINGSGFTGTTALTFGSTAATNIQVINDSQVTATVPAHFQATVNVSVTTPGGNATLPNSYTYIQPSLSDCHAPLIAVVGVQTVTCDTTSLLSVGVLSTRLVASGTNTASQQCSNFSQPVVATVGVLGILVIPTVGVSGLLSPGLIGCSIRLCSTNSCNTPGDTNASTVHLGL